MRGWLLTRALVNFAETVLEIQIMHQLDYLNRLKKPPYLAALSKKLRTYFFCSTSGLIASATCSTALERSWTYADCPLTCLTVDQGVLDKTVNGGSQAFSNSRSMTPMDADTALQSVNF